MQSSKGWASVKAKDGGPLLARHGRPWTMQLRRVPTEKEAAAAAAAKAALAESGGAIAEGVPPAAAAAAGGAAAADADTSSTAAATTLGPSLPSTGSSIDGSSPPRRASLTGSRSENGLLLSHCVYTNHLLPRQARDNNEGKDLF